MWHPQKSGTYNTLNFPSFLGSVQTIVTLGHIHYENAVKLVWKPTSLWWKILSSLGSSTNLNCVSLNLYLITLSFPFYGLGALYANPLIMWTPQNIYLHLIYLFSKDSRWSREGKQQRILYSKEISQYHNVVPPAVLTGLSSPISGKKIIWREQKDIKESVL